MSANLALLLATAVLLAEPGVPLLLPRSLRWTGALWRAAVLIG